MTRLLVRRSAAGLALGALAATGLAAVPAPASAVVTSPFVVAHGDIEGGDPSCTVAGAADDPAELPWSDNGVAVSNQVTKSGTITSDSNLADVTDASLAASATVSSTPLGTAASATITASGTARVSVLPRLGASDCEASASATGGAATSVKLIQPTWVTIAGSGSGAGPGGAGDVTILGAGGRLHLGTANRSHGSVTALLPTGDVTVMVQVGAYAVVTSENVQLRSSSYTASFTISLDPVGTGSAVAGKGKSYVGFDARSCPAGSVAVSLTKKAQKKAKLVQIKVNGQKATKFKGKKLKKRTVAIAAPASSEATIDAIITLKNGKKVTVTRSYLACS